MQSRMLTSSQGISLNSISASDSFCHSLSPPKETVLIPDNAVRHPPRSRKMPYRIVYIRVLRSVSLHILCVKLILIKAQNQCENVRKKNQSQCKAYAMSKGS